MEENRDITFDQHQSNIHSSDCKARSKALFPVNTILYQSKIMIRTSAVRLTISLVDSDLDDEERDRAVYQLLKELQDLDAAELVERVKDPNPPEGNKALGGFLVNLLMLEVNLENTKRLFGFLGDRLSGKQIELEVEANGKKLKVKASSREELEAAIKAAQEFVAA